MTDAECPNCGAAHDLAVAFAQGACPACDTPLAELHALALEGER
jgi:hypothetical protein